MKRRGNWSKTKWIVSLAVVALGAAGCTAPSGAGSGASGGPTGGSTGGTVSPVMFAVFNPFSGPDAAFGAEMLAACDAASQAINRGGGVIGHQTSCKGFDTHGDPADAVAAANQMVATNSNIIGALGPSSDEALATVPILNHAQIPMSADTGQAAFDHSNTQYFWRLSPADDVKGYAMAIWAHKKGYTRAATVFGNDVGSQSNLPTLVKAFTKLGGKVVSNEPIALNQSSYQTEVEKLLAAHPQVIFTEESPTTAATFFSELQQLNHGKLIPIVGTETTLEANWIQAVVKAVGGGLVRQYQVGVQPYAPPSGPAYLPFRSAILSSKGAAAKNLAVYSTDPYAMGYWDSINVFALAAAAAHSVSPAVFNKYIPKVSNPGKGKIVVHTYSDGVKALKQGKQIQYIGPSGELDFNRWHNSTGAFEVAGYVRAGKIKLDGEVTAADIANLSGSQ